MVAISVKLFRTHCNSARAKCICADSISGKQKLKLCEMGYQVKAMYFLFASVKSNTVLFAYTYYDSLPTSRCVCAVKATDTCKINITVPKCFWMTDIFKSIS